MSVRGVDLLPLVRGAVEVRCVEIDLFVALDLETAVEVEVEVEDEVGFRARASVPRLYITPDLFFRPTQASALAWNDHWKPRVSHVHLIQCTAIKRCATRT